MGYREDIEGSNGSDSFTDRPFLIFRTSKWMEVPEANPLTPKLVLMSAGHQVAPLRNLTANKPIISFLKLSRSSLLHSPRPSHKKQIWKLALLILWSDTSWLNACVCWISLSQYWFPSVPLSLASCTDLCHTSGYRPSLLLVSVWDDLSENGKRICSLKGFQSVFSINNTIFSFISWGTFSDIHNLL